MAKKVPYYSNDRKLYPMTKTEYVNRGGRWFPVSREQEMISRKQAGYVLDKHGLPFERSHRLEKRDKYRHNEPYDTFSSISPDGRQKSEWYVDWNAGHENYIRAARRSYAAKLGKILVRATSRTFKI